MRQSVAIVILLALATGCGSTGSSNSGKSARPATTPQPRPVALKTPESSSTAPVTRVFPTPTIIPAAAYTASIRGRITDAATGAPLAGAGLKVGFTASRETRTDAFGRYHLSFPAGEPAPVIVNMNGYAGTLAMGKMRPHRSFTLNVKLRKLSAGGKPTLPPQPISFGSP